MTRVFSIMPEKDCDLRQQAAKPVPDSIKAEVKLGQMDLIASLLVILRQEMAQRAAEQAEQARFQAAHSSEQARCLEELLQSSQGSLRADSAVHGSGL